MGYEILCAVVMKDTKLLSDYTQGKGGNCRDAITNVIFPKLPETEQRRTLKQSPFEFHYKRTESHTFFAVTDAGYKKKTIWGFIDEIEREVIKLGLAANSENVRKMLTKTMNYYNNPDNSQMIDLHTKMDSIKDVHVDNMDKILKGSGDKIKILEEKEKIKSSTGTLRKGAGRWFCCF